MNNADQNLWLSFAIAVLIIVASYIFYGVNMAAWCNSPDFGWITMEESGPNVVAEVFLRGEQAGMRNGDIITAINDQKYTTFDELYLKVRNTAIGAKNVYTIDRNSEPITLSITNDRVGLANVLKRCGALFFIGLIYVVIGVLVFLMKPRAVESCIFFLMSSIIGIKLSYAARVDLFQPFWLFDFRLLIDCLLPAPLIHFAFVFPKKRSVLIRHRFLWIVPYLLSFILFGFYQLLTNHVWDRVPLLNLLTLLYILLGILVFLFLTLWNIFKPSSVIVRLQAQVIFIGILIAFLVPVIDGFLRAYGNISFFPDPTINFAIFLSIFPISIGYTIVKHDLFAIDVIVRRTYGYLLSTSLLVVAYSLIVSLTNIIFQSSKVSQSPVFSIIFALGAFFFLKPLHERIQKIVDHLFYRQKYDYRKTIKRISETMIRMLDPDQIHHTLVGSVVREMALENGLLLLPNSAGENGMFTVQAVDGDIASAVPKKNLSKEDNLPKILGKKKNALLKHQVEMNPVYQDRKENLIHSFESFESELMLPLFYQDDMRGIISLGRKKSGKMFTPEDLDLLKTITNQSAVALENARLFQENIEKTRMEEELKIAHDIQASMLPEQPPQSDWLTIAASSFSAREVGGDFFDFVEMENDGNKQIGILVGDVSGKAVSGALVMAAARSIFRVLSDIQTTVCDRVIAGNKRLKRDIKSGMFVALVYVVFLPKEKKMTLVNAGQTEPILCRSGSADPQLIDTAGDRFPLGILDECDYKETTFSLRAGDTIVLYTDGIVEAMNEENEMYGFDRFMEVIGAHHAQEADALLNTLMGDVTSFVGNAEQHDDLTIVIVKIK